MIIDVIRQFARGVQQIVDMLDSVQIFSVVSLFDLMIGGVVLCMIISVFWKGVGT